MKEIINGVSYDTNKSVLLESVDSGFKKEDIRWSVTTLFRTRSGKFFLHGIGGPGSPYAQTYEYFANKEGEEIIPMSSFKVIIWVEEYLPDEKLKIFLKDMEHNLKRLGLEVPANHKASYRSLVEKERYNKLAAAKKAKDSQQTYL